MAPVDGPLAIRWATQSEPPALLQRMAGHAGAVHCVAFLPDGKGALSGGADGALIVWDLATGTPQTALTGHTAGVTSLAVTPDGTTAFSGSLDATIRRWHLADGLCTQTFSGHTAPVRFLHLTPTGMLLSTSDDQTLRLWDPNFGKSVCQFDGHTDRIPAAVLTPDGQWAISAGDDRTLRVWSLADGSQVRVIPCEGGYVSCLVVTQDGKQLITGSDDRLLRLWEVATGELLAVWDGHTGGVRDVTTDGLHLFSADNSGVVCVRRLSDGVVESRLPAHAAPITSLALSADGAQILTGSQDHTLALWNRERLALPFRQGHAGSVTGLAFTADGCHLVSCGEDGELRLWDGANGDLLDSLAEEAALLCLAALPGGGVLVGDSAGGLRQYALADSGRFVRPGVPLGEQRGALLAVAVSSDGSLAAVGTDTWAVVVWDLGTGQRRHVLAGHRGAVLALTFLPDGTGLLSADENWVIRRWDVSTGVGAPLGTPFDAAVETLAVAADGRQVVAGLESGRIVCLALPEGEVIAEWRGHDEWVAGVALFSAGDLLLSAGGDGAVCLWRGTDGEVLLRHEFGVPFSRLASAGEGVLALGDEEGGIVVLAYPKNLLQEGKQ
jgi:WD40 repeat protein